MPSSFLHRLQSRFTEMIHSRLKDVQDPREEDGDGLTVEGRMQGLLKQTAEDIKLCANLCDVWSKKKLLARILKAPFWEDKFSGFEALFAQRRKDFMRAMSMHAVRSLGQANVQLGSLTSLVEERYVVAQRPVCRRSPLVAGHSILFKSYKHMFLRTNETSVIACNNWVGQHKSCRTDTLSKNWLPLRWPPTPAKRRQYAMRT